jgi:hypothetical protein
LIFRGETVIRKCSLLYDIVNILQVPCIVTEQNPKALGINMFKRRAISTFFSYRLGKTVVDIYGKSPGVYKPFTAVFEKKQFSMITEEVMNHLKPLGKSQVTLTLVFCNTTMISFLNG